MPSRRLRSRSRNERSDGIRISSTPVCRGVSLIALINSVACSENCSAGIRRPGSKAINKNGGISQRGVLLFLSQMPSMPCSQHTFVPSLAVKRAYLRFHPGNRKSRHFDQPSSPTKKQDGQVVSCNLKARFLNSLRPDGSLMITILGKCLESSLASSHLKGLF